MSSLSDIQQIHGMLQEISKLLDEVDTKTDNVTKKTGASTESFRKLEMVALRYLTIVRQLGLPEDVNQAIQTVASLIVILRQLQMTINIIQVGMGPIGWASLAASGALTIMSATSFGYDLMRGT